MARVLIIDDDHEISAMLGEILRREGHEPSCASEPAGGLAAARAGRPDLIILDYHMPGENGAHLFESLRRNTATREVPVLFMSGEASPEEVFSQVCEAEGARFLPKPVALEDFRRAVREMLAASAGSA